MSRKIYFKHGVMGSAKSLDLIRAEYNYRERGMGTLVFVPEIGTRCGGQVLSRVGLAVPASIVSETDDFYEMIRKIVEIDNRDIKAVFIDEAHFFTVEQIDQLTEVADKLDIPVLCYGLRTDFRNKLFPSSARLMEVADSIEEIKAMCECGRKSTYNARFIDGKPVKSGEQFMVGDEQYKSFCRSCYKNLFR
ncbi:MAG TPA: thymidine kinase [Victivallales bacterium]|nr:thymidine kinase [Victivallales bacterium]